MKLIYIVLLGVILSDWLRQIQCMSNLVLYKCLGGRPFELPVSWYNTTSSIKLHCSHRIVMVFFSNKKVISFFSFTCMIKINWTRKRLILWNMKSESNVF